MPKYPRDCTDEEKFRVESLARQVLNIMLMNNERIGGNWPKYFWRKNHDLAPCKECSIRVSGGRPVSEPEGRSISEILEANAKSVRAFLTDLSAKVRVDLYDPTRDEVLFGLFSRVTRLYVLMLEDVHLWARDTAGIMLRCLADTAICFSYLARRGTEKDFQKFVDYGEGQAKLLMLHLQDSYPNDTSLEGLTPEEMSQELGGGVTPEFLTVELGNWTKKDTRKLAISCGMERIYRLVFSPTSSDLHGNWLSLRGSNLAVCSEPMHRYHKLPSFSEPPFFLQTAEVAGDVYRLCQDIGKSELGFPESENPIRSIAAELGLNRDEEERA